MSDPTDANAPVQVCRFVTVVIPALNAASTISEQLEALDAQVDAPHFEVVVVDNGSTDNTATTAAAFRSGRFDVRVVTEPRRGVNSARNAGIAESADGIILLCDADDHVSENWVKCLAEVVDERNWAIGSLDYASINDDQTLSLWKVPRRLNPKITSPYIDETPGGCCGFARTMWLSLGGFDARLSGPGDEHEFFMRAYMAGFRPRLAQGASVAYRLRPSQSAWLRSRYRVGKGIARAARLPGGVALRQRVDPRQVLPRVLRALMTAPMNLPFQSRRRAWLELTLREVGYLVGWFRSRTSMVSR